MERTIVNPIPTSHAQAASSVEGAIKSWVPIGIVLFLVVEGFKVASSQVPGIEGLLSTRIQAAGGPNILNGAVGAPAISAPPPSVTAALNGLPGPNVPTFSKYDCGPASGNLSTVPYPAPAGTHWICGGPPGPNGQWTVVSN